MQLSCQLVSSEKKYCFVEWKFIFWISCLVTKVKAENFILNDFASVNLERAKVAPRDDDDDEDNNCVVDLIAFLALFEYFPIFGQDFLIFSFSLIFASAVKFESLRTSSLMSSFGV